MPGARLEGEARNELGNKKLIMSTRPTSSKTDNAKQNDKGVKG